MKSVPYQRCYICRAKIFSDGENYCAEPCFGYWQPARVTAVIRFASVVQLMTPPPSAGSPASNTASSLRHFITAKDQHLCVVLPPRPAQHLPCGHPAVSRLVIRGGCRPASSQANQARNDARPAPRRIHRLGDAASQRAVVAADAHAGCAEADSEREDRVEPSFCTEEERLAVFLRCVCAASFCEGTRMGLTWISSMPVGRWAYCRSGSMGLGGVD
jgi:hypothetical protein